MKETKILRIKRIINTFLNGEIPELYNRNINFSFNLNLRKVYTIIGPRRSGKTYFCYQIINNLLNNKVDKRNILYFNLENDEIFPLELNDLNIILDSYFEITGKIGEKVYLFLDEIQEVPNWEKFIRKILDNYNNVEIVITGSSSTLLSKEISTTLRGRSLNMEFLPLNFLEYSKFKKFNIDKIGNKENILFNISRKEFLLYGSFPEVSLIENHEVKKQIIKDYFDLIFYKDIIDRNGFKSLQKLKLFRKLLISNMGDYISINNISKNIKVENITLSNWLQAFVDSYFIFELKKLDFSIMESEASRSKIYLIDNGFYTSSFGGIKEDYGKLLENLVFLEFRKNGFIENENIFYFITKSGYEIDFIISKDNIIKAYQVCYSLSNKKTRDREIRALLDLKRQFGTKISEYNIITYEDYEFNELDGIKICKFDEIFIA